MLAGQEALGPGVGMGHASLFLSTLATPAPAVPRRDSQMVQMVPQRQEEVPLTQAGSFSAHALSTSPGLRQAAWERGYLSMHMDTQIHTWEKEHTRSMYVHAYGCLCAHVISDHVHTVQGVGGYGLGCTQP